MEYVNNTGLPSVTNILSPYIDSRWFKREHTDRGTACHDVMYALALEMPTFGINFNPLHKPYIDSGMEWFNDNVKEVLLAEERFEIPGSHCGQPDLIALMKWDKVALIDWKTSVAQAKTWKFQAAAYVELVEVNTSIKIDERIAVRLRRDFNKPCLVNKYPDYDYDLGIFNCAKALWKELK